jgi:hypothetical protein
MLERRQHHGLTDGDDCAFCSQAPEMIDQLLVAYIFSRELWFSLLRHYRWQALTPQQGATFSEWWLECATSFKEITSWTTSLEISKMG